jgi:hypothetical protein
MPQSVISTSAMSWPKATVQLRMSGSPNNAGRRRACSHRIHRCKRGAGRFTKHRPPPFSGSPLEGADGSLAGWLILIHARPKFPSRASANHISLARGKT